MRKKNQSEFSLQSLLIDNGDFSDRGGIFASCLPALASTKLGGISMISNSSKSGSPSTNMNAGEGVAKINDHDKKKMIM